MATSAVLFRTHEDIVSTPTQVGGRAVLGPTEARREILRFLPCLRVEKERPTPQQRGGCWSRRGCTAVHPTLHSNRFGSW